jgi:site-specific DNA-methyltransferase (adenine-specific)
MSLPTPAYDRDGITLYHGDCLDLLPHLPAVDAVISDPQYGMDWDTDTVRFSGGKYANSRGQGREGWGGIEGDDEPFDPSPWLDFPRVVLWGANHYAARLPVGTTLVWIKRSDDLFGSFLSDAEIGWMKGGRGVYCHRKQFPPPSRAKEGGGSVAHPTQKPIGLMKWCLQRAKVPEGGLVLDPFAGSGTTGVACAKTGRRCILIEKDERYIPFIIRRMRECETPLFNTPAP